MASTKRTRKPTKTAGKAAAPTKRGSASPKDKNTITLRFKRPNGKMREVAFAPPSSMKRDAMRWAYIARIRRRWKGGTPGEDNPLASAIPWTALSELSAAEVVEVSIPYTDEVQGWEARIFPWEWMLSELIRPFRKEGRKLTVVRHLACATAAATAAPLGRACLVESAPGKVADEFDLAGEAALVGNMLAASGNTVRVVKDPTRMQLAEVIGELKPGLIHLAGVDSHQAVELLGLEVRDESDEPDKVRDPRQLDGMLLQGERPDAPDFVVAADLARTLTSATEQPRLVSFNFYNSAARLAALTVANGASTAIGFQDTIDDNLAEQFFAGLYHALSIEGLSLFDAFPKAIAAVRASTTGLQGACIVLWTRESLFGAQPKAISKRTATRSPEAHTVPARDRIQVECKPLSEVNYSLLQNGGSPVLKLQVSRRSVSGPIYDIRVAVTLYVGQEPFPYVTTFDLQATEVGRSIGELIVIPLTSALIRTESERMKSTLHVQVTCGGDTVLESTWPMTLCPVDEWTDTDANRLWLPSFVLPRDPAVARIIESAQRYLMAITDDPAAGFDGYQSVDEGAATLEGKYGAVDLQVRAIWSALLHEHRLSYVNPPPSYGDGTQRLRMPSTILSDRRGTCIDLALLLCACLELIEIYPVVFLLEAHAFPGYWRSPVLHEQFRSARDIDVPLPHRNLNVVRTGTSARNQTRYTAEREDYFDLRNRVGKGHLVPLETVWLTNYSGFGEAVVEGERNMRSRRDFQGMIDIVLAREEDVTPLPMVGRGA